MVKQQAHHPIAVEVVAIAIIMVVPFLLDHLDSVQVLLILVPVVNLDKQRTRILE
jgi:hypothetical protein